MKQRIILSLVAVAVFAALYLVGINGKHAEPEAGQATTDSPPPAQPSDSSSGSSFSGIGK